jgi:hypothetical protein
MSPAGRWGELARGGPVETRHPEPVAGAPGARDRPRLTSRWPRLPQGPRHRFAGHPVHPQGCRHAAALGPVPHADALAPPPVPSAAHPPRRAPSHGATRRFTPSRRDEPPMSAADCGRPIGADAASPRSPARPAGSSPRVSPRAVRASALECSRTPHPRLADCVGTCPLVPGGHPSSPVPGRRPARVEGASSRRHLTMTPWPGSSPSAPLIPGGGTLTPHALCQAWHTRPRLSGAGYRVGSSALVRP